MTASANDVPLVELTQVQKVFGADGRMMFALRDVSFQAFPGELVLFLGPSGSGKTTLLTMAAGLARPTSGTVRLFGRNVDSFSHEELQQMRSRQIGFVFQTFRLIDALTVAQNVQLVLGFAGVPMRESRQRSAALLRLFAIDQLASRRPPQLSQGEKQRVAVVRAMANSPQLIIADEPTASLETKQALQIIHLLSEYANTRGKCVLVASHDIRMMQHAHRVIRLLDGRIVNQRRTRSTQSQTR